MLKRESGTRALVHHTSFQAQFTLAMFQTAPWRLIEFTPRKHNATRAASPPIQLI
jgi:hypothetical protein